MCEAPSSDALKKLVLLMTGLAILGTAVARAFNFAVALPIRHAAALIPPPDTP